MEASVAKMRPPTRKSVGAEVRTLLGALEAERNAAKIGFNHHPVSASIQPAPVRRRASELKAKN
jgi:hypothetical protein